jgi:uncharacterized protein (TIGR03437 family)
VRASWILPAWFLFPILMVAAEPEDPVYSIRTVAGGNNVGDGRAAVRAQLSDAQGVAVDAAGNVYIADADNHRVRKVRPDGIIETVAGAGVPGFSGDGGEAARALLNAPYGVAVDASGNLYIADLGNRRVRKVMPDGRIETVAGNGQSGSGGDGGPAAAAQLSAPRNVAVDSAGALYIADFDGQRVRKVAAGIISTVAGNGVRGAGGDGGPAASASLAYPAGIAVDPVGALYIADSGNHRIRVVSGGVIATLLTAAAGTALRTPTGVAAGAGGVLYIADSANHRVVARFPSGDTVTVAGTGGGGVVKSLDTARDVALDAGGGIYIADGRKVRRVDPSGAAGVVIAGDGGFGYRGDNEPAVEAALNLPSGVAVGPEGVYIADERNHRLRVVSAGGIITTVAGTGAPGFGYDGATSVTSPVDRPTGVSVDPGGVVWFTESGGNRVRKLTPGGGMITVAGKDPGGVEGESVAALSARLHAPAFALMDAQGVLYFSDSGAHKVRKIQPGGLLATVAGTGDRGFGGDGGPAAAGLLDTPRGLAFDAAGNLYIADSGNHRIRRVSPDGRIATFGEGAALRNPAGVAVTLQSDVLVADTQNHRVAQLRPDGSLTTLAGSPGIPGFGGDGGPAGSALLSAPAAIAVDAVGSIYIADTGNQRIRVLEAGLAAPVADPVVDLPPLTGLRILNAASLEAGRVAPGELVSLVGTRIGPAAGVSAAIPAARNLGGSEVWFDGQPAPVISAAENMVTAQAPFAIAGRARTEIEVRLNGATRASGAADVALAAPGVFTGPGGLVLASNEDGSPNAPSAPAQAGSVIALFATGSGETTPAGSEGQPAGDPPAKPVLPVAVTVGGESAPVLFAGSGPGLIGILQVNVRVPALRPGPAAVVLFVGGARSQEGAWVSIR